MPAPKRDESECQDKFIDGLINSQKEVSVYLASGIKLIGIINGADRYTVLMTGDYGTQLIYKSAISTICLYTRAPTSKYDRSARGS